MPHTGMLKLQRTTNSFIWQVSIVNIHKKASGKTMVCKKQNHLAKQSTNNKNITETHN